MTVLHDIAIDEADVAPLCKHYGISKLWLFGSILSGDFNGHSDIDVLTACRDVIGLFELGGFSADLSDLWGRPVHITMIETVPPHYRNFVLQKAKLLYADS